MSRLDEEGAGVTDDSFYEEHWYAQQLQALGERLLNEQIPVGDGRVICMALEAISEQLGKLAVLLPATFDIPAPWPIGDSTVMINGSHLTRYTA